MAVNNSSTIIGRLVKDAVKRYADNGLVICKFTVAVDRKVKAEGQPTADFIPVVWFGKKDSRPDKLTGYGDKPNYLTKGKKVAVNGHIQTGSYTSSETGQKVYTTEIVVDDFEFEESASASSAQNGNAAQQQAAQAPVSNNAADGFKPIPQDGSFGFDSFGFGLPPVA